MNMNTSSNYEHNFLFQNAKQLVTVKDDQLQDFADNFVS